MFIYCFSTTHFGHSIWPSSGTNVYIIGKVCFGDGLPLLHKEHEKIQQLGIIPNKEQQLTYVFYHSDCEGQALSIAYFSHHVLVFLCDDGQTEQTNML